ncbi:hypothetical protein [Vibrio metschnikovii]|uniref:hypothetical protein n=2 Tax=Vibrio metschnikovii TaxID=28172 RepID=UPI002FC88BC5
MRTLFTNWQFRGHCIMKKLSFIPIISIIATLSFSANANSFGDYSYLGLGLQFSEQKSDSLSSFLGSDYTGKGSRSLFGVNVTGSYSPDNINGYGKVEYEMGTSGNTDVSSTFLGLGAYNNFHSASVFYTLGAVRYTVARERHTEGAGSDKFAEYGPAADIGIAIPISSFWSLTPRYRISYLDSDVMNDYKLTSQFMFGPTFSVELSVGYNTYRDAEQFNSQTALKFAF